MCIFFHKWQYIGPSNHMGLGAFGWYQKDKFVCRSCGAVKYR